MSLNQALSPGASRFDKFSPLWIIYDKVNVEAGYVNDPNDSGGETNHGITYATSREFKRLWNDFGWDGNMRTMPEDFAVAVYTKGWWEKMNLHNIHKVSPLVADKLFDFGINAGRSRAMSALQRWLTINNQRGTKYLDISDDGIFGSRTHQALLGFVKYRGKQGKINMLAALLCTQGEHYQNLANKREKDETFIHGWFTHRISADMLEYSEVVNNGWYD